MISGVNMTMRNLIALLIFCYAIVFAAALSAADASNSKLAATWNVEQLMATLATVSSGNKRFVEKKFISMLTEPIVLNGTLAYIAPSRLEKRILSPYDESYIVDGNTLQIHNPGKNIHRSFALPSYPALWAFVESFRATLAGDSKTLQRFYTTTLSGDRKNWELMLLPIEPSMLKAINSIRIKGTTEHITQIEVQETNGDRSILSIEDKP